MITLFIIVASISLGSFGNGLISFFIGKSRFEMKRSFCLCGEIKLGIIELIPIVNYFLLKGKCRHCKAALPKRYIIIELISGLLGLIIYLKYGFSEKFFIIFLFLFLLTIIAVIDFISFTIPNSLLIALALTAAAKSILIPEELISTLLVSLATTGFLLLHNLFFVNVTHKEAIGFGDIKLLAIIALLYGYPLLFFGLWLSALTGLIGYLWNKKIWNERIPFGFFIWIGFILTELLNDRLMSFYFELMR